MMRSIPQYLLPPCKDCQDRQVGCHGKCNKYKKYKKELEAIKADIKIRQRQMSTWYD